MSYSVNEIVEKVRLQMPLQMTLTDPVTRDPIVVSRDNILSMLISNHADLATEIQILPAIYAEIGRLAAAADYAAEVAERQYRQWKTGVIAAARAQNGKLTVAQSEEAYRSHDDYAVHADLPVAAKALASTLNTLKSAFQMKGRMLELAVRAQLGSDSVDSSTSVDHYR